MSSATQHGRESSTQTVSPIAVRAYFVSAVALDLTALFGGGNLVAGPSGERMEMSLEWLAGTPFTDYFVPGLILFAVLGI